MRTLDPRLLRHASAARRYVLLTATLGGLTAALVVAQALLLAAALAPVVAGEAEWPDVAAWVGLLALVVLGRVGVTAAQERYAHRSATRAVAELREQVLAHAVALGPRWLARSGATGVATLATRGLDALEPYFVRYLPQLLLAATVTPAALAVVLGLDWVAGLTIAVTLPLVPVFMVLTGRLTAGYAARRLKTMRTLGNQVLDLLTGLPTLRALGRERGPQERVRELGHAHRRATMATLRVAFLSGMVLELLTTLSVALVAVGIGLRLVDGGMDLRTGIAVLVLAPEVYLPLRQLGTHFHAASDGIAAAQQAFEVLAEPLPPRGTRPAPDLRSTTIRLRGVSVAAPERAELAPHALDLDLAPGRVVALAGPNGSGKSTAVAVLLGLVVPDAGTVELLTAGAPPLPLADVDTDAWLAQVAWVPQRPVLVPGGLSLGERQRLALAGALAGGAQLVILDEPAAHLDAASAARVTEAVADLRDAGRTVLLVTHHAELLDLADSVVTVRSGVTVRAGVTP